jgi:hypothetical protein
MGWLSLCAALSLAAINVRIASLDGSTVEGQLRSLSSAGVTISGNQAGSAEQNIALDQVLSVQRTDSAAVTRPASRVGLAGGSRIAIRSITTEGSTAKLAVRNQSPLRVPMKQLSWVRFGAPSAAVDPQWLGLIDRPRAADALVVRRAGDSIDEVSGIVVGISSESVSFDLDGDKMQAPLTRLEGLLFANPAGTATETKGMVTIDDIDGSRWVAASLGAGTDSEVELKLGDDLIYRLPLDRIDKIELTGSVEFLADQQPVESKYTPYVAIGLPAPIAEKWFAPQVVGGRDLLMRATSHVEYRVGDGNETLVGSFEYDPAVTAGGNCVVRILLDAKPVWEQTLDVSDPSPRGFELPLNGARRIRLEVATGGDGDLGDTVRVRQPRMMK